MPRITDKFISGTAISLHLLQAADEAPTATAYDGAGTNNLIDRVIDIGDLEDSWNLATFQDYGQRREEFLQTFKSTQEIEVTLPWRVSEAAQAAIIAAGNSRATVVLAILISNGDVAPDEDQITFSAKVTSTTDMFPKDDRLGKSFTFTLVGDAVYSAKVT